MMLASQATVVAKELHLQRYLLNENYTLTTQSEEEERLNMAVQLFLLPDYGHKVTTCLKLPWT